MYDLLRPLLFQLDAERAHNLTFSLLESLGGWANRLPPAVPLEPDERLAVELAGLLFEHPIGLAAGLDKNARLLHVWRRLGFSFVEVGTITPRPQAGNPKPRLFRLPADRALVNRMGFNNDGMEAIGRRLERRPAGLIVGANVGKNKDTELDRAADDYRDCIRHLNDRCDFFTVNISSPNTPGLRSLQQHEPLMRLLGGVAEEIEKQRTRRPWFVKIAPDLTEAEIDDLARVIESTGAAGAVATNTTVSRAGLRTPAARVAAIGDGGLSGAPLRERSLEVTRRLAAAGLPVIGAGGIMSGADAKARLEAGAKLVQVYTGFVYRGPALLKEIYEELLAAKGRA